MGAIGYSTWKITHLAWKLEQKLDRELVASDVEICEEVPSLNAYIRHFGSWNNFKDELERYKREELQVA